MGAVKAATARGSLSSASPFPPGKPTKTSHVDVAATKAGVNVRGRARRGGFGWQAFDNGRGGEWMAGGSQFPFESRDFGERGRWHGRLPVSMELTGEEARRSGHQIMSPLHVFLVECRDWTETHTFGA